MQINPKFKALIAGLSMLSLVACSTVGSKNGNGTTSSDDGSGSTVVANGIGSDDGFGSYGNAKAMQVGNQHYYFDFNSNDIHSVDMPSIKVQANYLATHSSAKVLLTGNTDERGSREYNIGLGNRRANSVAKILELDGVNASQITVVSYGAEKPVALGHDEASYAKNRRVDLIYQTPISK